MTLQNDSTTPNYVASSNGPTIPKLVTSLPFFDMQKGTSFQTEKVGKTHIHFSYVSRNTCVIYWKDQETLSEGDTVQNQNVAFHLILTQWNFSSFEMNVL